MTRTAVLERRTKETSVRATVNLDGDGTNSRIETPVGFLSHMIDVIARHGRVDIDVIATGDTFIDYHHTVEDVALVLGEAFGKALGDKAGIRRFGHAYVPLDEALSRVVVDLSGRPYLVYKAEFRVPRIGDLQTELIEEFLKALVQEGKFNLHVENLYGRNQHHIAETIFKATARALHAATRMTGGGDVPSTKGVL